MTHPAYVYSFQLQLTNPPMKTLAEDLLDFGSQQTCACDEKVVRGMRVRMKTAYIESAMGTGQSIQPHLISYYFFNLSILLCD